MSRGVGWATAAMALVRVLSAGCAFVLFWLVARSSPEALGTFRTVFIFFTFTEFLPLLGMNQFVIREVAIAGHARRGTLLNALVFAGLISSFAAVGLLVLGRVGAYSPAVAHGLVLVVLALPATALMVCAQSVLIGLGQGSAWGRIQALETTIRTLAGIAVFAAGGGVLGILACIVAARWLSVLLYWRSVGPQLEPEPWHFDRAAFVDFLREAPVFSINLLLSLVTRFSAQLLVPWMCGDTAAGHFAAAYQLVDLALLVPTAMVINLMPVFAQHAASRPAELTRTVRQALRLFALGTIPMALVVSTLAGPILVTIFGRGYLPSVPMLRLLIWIAPLASLDQVLSATCIARRQQRLDLYALLAGSAVVLPALVLSIHAFGERGAALGFLLGYAAVFAARLVVSRRVLPDLRPLHAICGGRDENGEGVLVLLRTTLRRRGPHGMAEGVGAH